MERLTDKRLLEKAKINTLVFYQGTAEEPILISQEDADDEKRILESLIKLTKLEDIEEKYGIDLIAVFNNFEKDGLIWCGSKGKIIQIVDTDKRVYYEDKELTKEELEK